MLYSHLKCLLSNVFYLIIMCFFYSCSIQLCTSISKIDAPISQSKEFKKNFTLWTRERVSSISEDKDSMFIFQDNIFCNWTNMFATPSFCWILHELLLFILYFDSYQTCFYFFYSCYYISCKNTMESFLDEINFFRAMPKYDVMFIMNPIWHFSLSKKQCVKICCGIPCQIVMWH